MRLWLIAVLVLCTGNVWAQGQVLVPEGDPEVGRKLYTSYCTRCHGINLVATSGAYFDLRTFPRDDKERFLRSMNEGKRAMPAWKGIVKPDQMEAIWAYIGKVNNWEPSK